jgi:ATP-dependent Lon protease, bacterial type
MNYPVLPLRDIVIFPHMIVPLFVGRDKSVLALEEAMSKKKEIVLLSQKDPRTEDPKKKDLFDVGTIGKILQLLKLPDGTVKVLVEGKKRVKVTKICFEESFLKADVKTVVESADNNVDKTKINVLHTVFEDFINLNKKTNNELINVISEIKDPGHLSDTIASNLNLEISEKQKFLENFNVSKRIEGLIIKLETEIGSLQAENKVRSRVKRQMEKIQREYYLNEQLKAIQKELGTSEDGKNEFQELDEKIKKVKLSKEALKR